MDVFDLTRLLAVFGTRDRDADLNRNGVVDLADHVVWRATLGSMSDLEADHSGPVAGVPDGVVDQFDYDFWTANFGEAGIPGSGSGAGAADMAAAAVLSA